jgi:hypothetical protein
VDIFLTRRNNIHNNRLFLVLESLHNLYTHNRIDKHQSAWSLPY